MKFKNMNIVWDPITNLPAAKMQINKHCMASGIIACDDVLFLYQAPA